MASAVFYVSEDTVCVTGVIPLADTVDAERERPVEFPAVSSKLAVKRDKLGFNNIKQYSL